MKPPRFFTEAILPSAGDLAPILAHGSVAVIVHAPSPATREAARAAGWDGETMVFPMSIATRRLVAMQADAVTAAWIGRDDGVGRIFVFSGAGTALVNFASGRGYWIEPGSLDGDRS